MDDIFVKIKEMGILLALGSLLQHLLPSQEYGRYVRLLTITILVAYFTMPLCRFFERDGFEKFCISCDIYYAKILKGVNGESFDKSLEEKVDAKWYEWGKTYLEEGMKESEDESVE